MTLYVIKFTLRRGCQGSTDLFNTSENISDINDIKEAISTNRVRISDHADEESESESDQLTFEEINYSVSHGEIIESHINDKPYPSCLIFGKTSNGNPVHSVWAYNKESEWAVIITVYRPDPEIWKEWKERRNML